MDTISTTVWQRQGLAIIFDQLSLRSFISGDLVISLREFLDFENEIPSNPPFLGQTIIVSGLETILDTIEPQQADDFLSGRIRPLLRNLQNHWTQCGVVFGFTTHPGAFEETAMQEEVHFRRRDRKQVRLSDGLWDGSATMNMKRIVRIDENNGDEIIIGYYVARIS